MSKQQKLEPSPAKQKPAADKGANESRRERDKLAKRRIAWCWNRRLLLISLPFLLLVLTACFVSYCYHSSVVGSAFLSNAEVAEAEGNYKEQLKWLGRYTMLEPGDVDGVVNMALAANKMADVAEFEDCSRATQIACKQIGGAIGRLGSENYEDKSELRKLLINRLLQLGTYRYREAEKNIITLAAPDHDRQSTKWMALALAGQVSEGTYKLRSPEDIPPGAGHWRKLSFRKPGEVLFEALEYSPKDVYLLQNLVSMAQSHPDLFELSSGGSAEAKNPAHPHRHENRLELQKRVGERLRAIENNEDSWSRIVRFTFDCNYGRSVVADSRLENYAETVKQRLQQSEDSQAELWNSEVGQSAPIFWDYVLLARVAKSLCEQNPSLARSYYEVLNNVESKWIPKSHRETEFLLSGQLAYRQGDISRVHKVFQKGIKVLPDSMKLKFAVAQVAVDLQRQQIANPTADKHEFPDFTKALEDFRKTVGENFLQLTSLQKGNELSAARTRLGHEIEIARWRLSVLEAKFESTKGQANDAIEKLDFALNAQVEVGAKERVSVATDLADLYLRNGSYDLAARAFERAIEITPSDLKIRMLAAEAWGRCRNFERASKQWQVVGRRPVEVAQRVEVGSLIGRISSCQNRFNEQFQKLPNDRDFSGVRVWIEELEEDLKLAITDFDGSDERLKEIESRLAILRSSMPRRGSVTLENTKESWAQLAALAEKRKDDPRFQVFAASRFVASGRFERAEQSLARLGQIVGEDDIQAVKVRAKIAAAKGEPLESARMLSQFVNETHQPALVESVLQLSAIYALIAGDKELAYQTLERSPVQTRRNLFMLYELVGELSPESTILKDSGKTAEELQSTWYAKLRKVEGEAGTHWRFLDARKAAENLLSRSKKVQHDDQELINAKRLVAEIIERRPRWGEAVSLGGWLLAAEGNSEAAVERIQMGVASGDPMIQSRYLLVKLLLKLGRIDEAESKIVAIRAQYSEGGGFDPDSRGLIVVEQNRGDFVKSTEIALEAAMSKPEDFMTQIVCAHTAIVAVKKVTNEEQRQEQVKIAEQAIKRAEKLADGEQSMILVSMLSLQLAKKDSAAAKQVIEKINASPLKRMQKLMLMSRGYIKLGEYDLALPLLLEAEELQSSSETQLTIAKVHKALNQPSREIDALRIAQKRDPENPLLRNQLAIALATRDQKDVDFFELNELLRTTEYSTEGNRFVHAILMSSVGDGDQIEKATGVLREIVWEKNLRSMDAARVLALVLWKQLEEQKDFKPGPENDSRLQSLLLEIRSLYDSLVDVGRPAPIDLFRFSKFLLENGDQQRDLARVEKFLDILKSSKDGTLADLDLGIQYAIKMSRRDDIPQIVSDWADRKKDNNVLPYGNVCAIAGQTLSRLRFASEAADWFGKAYETNPKMFAAYVVALNRAKRFERALSVCVEFNQANSEPGKPNRASLTLLSETIIGAPAELVTPQHQQLLGRVVAEKIKNPSLEDALLFESIATWQMKEQNYERAVLLYHTIDRLEREQGNKSGTERIRTLNNLAMSYSELEGRESGGIAPISRAIELARQNMPQALPELLDTQGVVFMRSGDLVKAEAAFRQCVARSKDPRFSFHLMLALRQQKKNQLAEEVWRNLDLEKLEANLQGLTYREKLQLEQLKKEYVKTASTLVQDVSQ